MNNLEYLITLVHATAPTIAIMHAYIDIKLAANHASALTDRGPQQNTYSPLRSLYPNTSKVSASDTQSRTPGQMASNKQQSAQVRTMKIVAEHFDEKHVLLKHTERFVKDVHRPFIMVRKRFDEEDASNLNKRFPGVLEGIKGGSLLIVGEWHPNPLPANSIITEWYPNPQPANSEKVVPDGPVTAPPPRTPAASKVQKKVHRNVPNALGDRKRVYDKVSSSELNDDASGLHFEKTCVANCEGANFQGRRESQDEEPTRLPPEVLELGSQRDASRHRGEPQA